jgi:2-keto-4-pentenoate hydratase
MSLAEQAADRIHKSWQTHQLLDHLPPDSRPADAVQGYAAQHALSRLRDEAVVGWKIAATSAAGRAHLNIDHPLAGRLYQSIVQRDGAQIAYQHNQMGVAEAEFVLVLGADLPARDAPYRASEVAEAVRAVCPGLELPDSRFSDFASVGAPSLVADNACASQFVLGDVARRQAPTLTELESLADHETQLLVNDSAVCHGAGRDALGGPLLALTWLANELSVIGCGLRAGEFVTTGVTGQPSPVAAGDTVAVDLGPWGRVTASLVE